MATAELPLLITMGATDSKLQFKRHVLQLCEVSSIPATDPYWSKFWLQPTTTTDVFTLLSASDIRRARVSHPENFQTLVSVICDRFLYLGNHHTFPSERAPARDLLNCARILTRVMPFLYEVSDPQDDMHRWEQTYFWTPPASGACPPPPLASSNQTNQPAPLGHQIMDVALELLFRPGFTTSAPTSTARSIWETGVGSTTPSTTTREMLYNRVEIVRLILSLCSDCLYRSIPSSVVSNGSPWLTYTVSHPDKHLSMTVLCSLLNTTLKYSPGWKVPYDHMLLADRNRQLVVYSLHLLLILLVYVVPGQGNESKINNYRLFFSKIHRPQDLQFIADMVTKLLSQPIHASSSYLPGSQQEIHWIHELVMLTWELLQCNNRFRSYVIGSYHAHDFMVLSLYYIHEKRSVAAQHNLVRLCAYVALYLSSHEQFAKSLYKRFEGHRYLPSSVKVAGFDYDGSYADYFMIQIINLIAAGGSSTSTELNSSGDSDHSADPAALIPTLLGVLYNIAPYVTGLQYTSCTSLMNLIFSAFTPARQIQWEVEPDVVALTLLKCLYLLITCNFRSNRNVVYVLIRNKAKLESLVSAKSKGKQAINVDSSGGDTDVDIAKYLSMLVEIADNVVSAVPYAKHINDTSLASASISSFEPSSSTRSATEKVDPHTIIESIGNIPNLEGLDINSHPPDTGGFERVSFIWDSDSLGWYVSVLWGSIFQADRQMSVAVLNEGVGVVGMPSSVASVWTGTHIKLFKIQELAPHVPSLRQPRGAVDALADAMMQKLRFAGTDSLRSDR